MQRAVAFILLLIPGFCTALGIKWMRDMLFGKLSFLLSALWVQFLVGFFLFAGGLAFIGGFIFYRDRKRNNVQDRFKRRPVQK